MKDSTMETIDLVVMALSLCVILFQSLFSLIPSHIITLYRYFINNNNNSEVLFGANIHRPDAPLASQERKESEN